jgi:hypothetical protein
VGEKWHHVSGHSWQNSRQQPYGRVVTAVTLLAACNATASGRGSKTRQQLTLQLISHSDREAIGSSRASRGSS